MSHRFERFSVFFLTGQNRETIYSHQLDFFKMGQKMGRIMIIDNDNELINININ